MEAQGLRVICIHATPLCICHTKPRGDMLKISTVFLVPQRSATLYQVQLSGLHFEQKFTQHAFEIRRWLTYRTHFLRRRSFISIPIESRWHVELHVALPLFWSFRARLFTERTNDEHLLTLRSPVLDCSKGVLLGFLFRSASSRPR